MQLRPRCTTCRQTGHTVCPQVTPPPPTPVVPSGTKCCSFCRKPGHYKPKCEEYKKSLVNPVVNPVAKTSCCSFCRSPNHRKPRCNLINILRDACAPELEKYKQKIQWLYILSDLAVKQEVKHYFNFLQASFKCDQLCELTESQYMSDILSFRLFVATNNYFCKFFESVKYQFASKYPKNIPKINLELCAENPKPEFQECGICLSDEIDHCNMVKLTCGHEFCGDCTVNLVNKKPRCAYCRADVKKVSVNSKQCFDLLKAHAIFV